MLLLPHSKEKLQRLCQAHFGLIPYSGAPEPEVIHNLFLLGKLPLKSFHLALSCEELWICSLFFRKACSEAFSGNLIPSTPSLTCFPKGTKHIQLQELSTHSLSILLLTFNKGEPLRWFQLQLTEGWRSQRHSDLGNFVELAAHGSPWGISTRDSSVTFPGVAELGARDGSPRNTVAVL